MALSHIVMHLSLCASTIREAANRDVPVRVVMKDKIERTSLDQKFSIERGTTREAPIEFEMPFGIYRATVTTPTCSAIVYLSILNGVNRGLPVSLQEGRVPSEPPVPALVEGTAPFEFSYVQPLVQVYPKTLKCNDPIGDPLDTTIEMDNEADSYYATIPPTPTLAQNYPAVVVVRLSDSHGGYQYVRVPIGEDVGLHSHWPGLGRVDISPGLIDAIAGKPEDTLICLKFLKTTVGG